MLVRIDSCLSEAREAQRLIALPMRRKTTASFSSRDTSSLMEVAGLTASGGTAMNALFYGPQTLEAGRTVLTQGTGGVSAHAIHVRLDLLGTHP